MSVIALETLKYATACVASGERTLAFYTINTSDNGLTFEQRDMALDLIASAGELREGRELSRFENRMLGVAQPATLEFLENPKAIAAVMSCFMPREPYYLPGKEFLPTLEVLGIQTSYSARNQHILRQKLKEITSFSIREIIDYLNKLRDLETGNSLSVVEFLELCPELEEMITFSFDDKIVAIYTWLARIGEALKNCKKTKFYRFVNFLEMPIEEIRKLKAFPHLNHFTFGEKSNVEEIEAVLEFPHLKSVEFRKSNTIANHLHLLKNPKLESIAIWWGHELSFFTEGQLEILSAVPFKRLSFNCSNNIKDDDLPRLFQIRSLETLDLSDCAELTKEGVIQFLRGIKSPPLSKIKKVILNADDWGDGMTRKEIHEIQAMFPHIVEIGPR